MQELLIERQILLMPTARFSMLYRVDLISKSLKSEDLFNDLLKMEKR